MYAKQLLVKDLQITVSINNDCNIAMKQKEPVFVTCTSVKNLCIDKVYADEGIEFASAGGILSVSYKQCADITSLCNKAALERQIRDEQEENDAMMVHTRDK